MQKTPNYSFQVEMEGLKISESHVYNKQSMKSRHYHETIELFVLTEGERYYFVDRYVYHMKEKMAVLIPPGQIHKTSIIEGKPEHKRFLLQFSKELFEGMIRSVLGITYEDLSHKYGGLITFSEQGWQRLMSKYDELKAEASKDPDDIDYSAPMIKCLAFELLIIYIQEMDMEQKRNNTAYSNESYRVTSGVYNTIQNVTEYINENYAEDITLEMLSDRFFVSRAGLTRAFRNITGITIVQYLTIVRIRMACQYLKTTNDSITTISSQCGFGNVTYFEKVFRRLRGMTPRQYRKIVS